ncbi:MAG TPA: urea ABC transporter permease subunit UrtC [Planctomycetota bacterium]|nr:urea ABC transporter permease subunit UrtC [Planctomycetota bacterium]
MQTPDPSTLPLWRRLHSPLQWAVLAVLAFVAIVVVPLCNSVVPPSSSFHLSDFQITLFGKYLTYAILALGMDLLWGYTGILSLGQGVFFALGGYCMGMYLMLHIGLEGQYHNELPDFMVFLNWPKLPWYWPPFRSFGFAIVAAVAAPTLFAALFGFLAFRSRIRGVYLSIITQALTYALMLLFFLNELGLGGNNGLTDYKTLAGWRLKEMSTMRGLYVVTGIVLVLTYILCRWITRTKLGRVLEAIRDGENRVRFSGYSPVGFKVFVFAVAAAVAAIAGALYVPQVGIINPSRLEAAESIEIAIWVAVGGRGTLYGAILGALVVNGLKSWLTNRYPATWLYVLGGVFVAVVMLLPDGLVSLPGRLRALWVKFAPKAPPVALPAVTVAKEKEQGA